MLTAEQYVQNDMDERYRVLYVLNAFGGALLGIDPGTAPYDSVPYGSRPDQYRIFSVSTGTAQQGQAGNVNATIAGYTVSMPMLFVLGAAALFLLRK